MRGKYMLDPAEQKEAIEKSGQRAILSYNQIDFVKNRIAVVGNSASILLWHKICT